MNSRYYGSQNPKTMFQNRHTVNFPEQDVIRNHQMDILLSNDNASHVNPQLHYNSNGSENSSRIINRNITNNLSIIPPTGFGSIKICLSTVNNLNYDSLKLNISDLKTTTTNLNNTVKIITSPFTLPRMSYSTTENADYYFNKEVYVYFEELPSSTSHFTTQHTLFKYTYKCHIVDLDSVSIQLVPFNPNIVFTYPLSNIDSITLSFYRKTPAGEYKRIDLLKPYIPVRAIAGTNPAQFEILSPEDSNVQLHGVVDVTYPFTASVKQAVSFKDIETTINSLDDIINREKGFFVSETYPTENRFIIDNLDLSILPANVDTNMYITKNIVDIELEFITNIYNNNNLTAIT